MNKSYPIILSLIIIIITGLAFLLFFNLSDDEERSQPATSSELPIDTIVLDSSYKLAKKALPERDAISVERPSHYIYSYYNDPEVKEHMEESSSTPKPQTISKRLPEATTTPPIYSKNCITAVNPTDCSQRRLDTYFSKVLINHGYEISFRDTLNATFLIDGQGIVNGPVSIEGETDCKDCKALLIKAISGMKDWSGAIKEGQPVRVKIVLPIII